MLDIMLLILLGVAAGVLFTYWRRVHLQQLGLHRLENAEQRGEAGVERVVDHRTFVTQHWLLPWLLGATLTLVLYFFTPLPSVFAITVGLLIGLIGGLLESFRVEAVTLKIEEQLADGIDLMVAALRAGVGVLGALESAAQEARQPLRRQLDEVMGRIRFGDDPQQVLRDLERRVPLETFRLFAAALSVHWETGGSLAPTLATVGRVIRDRIEVRRRIGTLTTQARASTVAVLGATYFIALIMWRNDPERMQRFLANVFGQGLVAVGVVLQAVGIIWVSALSKLRY
jgi:Flp pilus assembly protein TadB